MSDTTLDTIGPDSGTVQEKDLTTLQRVIVGGLGGTMPLIAVLAAGEYVNFETATESYYIGYAVRLFLFFFLGAVVVWLHADTRRRYPAFRLGMTAPALVASMLSTAAADFNRTKASAFSAPAEEVQVALLDDSRDRAAMSDALPSTVVFGNCSVVDGILGRKC